MYAFSLLSTFSMIIDLYVVLWAKVEDLEEIKKKKAIPKLLHESSENKNSKGDLEGSKLS